MQREPASLPPLTVCRLCREALHGVGEATVTPNVSVWAHREPGSCDHSPVPVPSVEVTTDLTLFCDFCSHTQPSWAYPVDLGLPAAAGDFTYTEDGWWAACDACADLIDLEDPQALVVDAVSRLRERSSRYREIPPATAKQAVAASHRMFWRASPGRRHALGRIGDG